MTQATLTTDLYSDSDGQPMADNTTSSKLMNNAILAEQWRKTGNLMELLNHEAWIQKADAEYVSDEGMVEAGPALKPYVELIKNAPPEALQRRRWYVRVLPLFYQTGFKP